MMLQRSLSAPRRISRPANRNIRRQATLVRRGRRRLKATMTIAAMFFGRIGEDLLLEHTFGGAVRLSSGSGEEGRRVVTSHLVQQGRADGSAIEFKHQESVVAELLAKSGLPRCR